MIVNKKRAKTTAAKRRTHKSPDCVYCSISLDENKVFCFFSALLRFMWNVELMAQRRWFYQRLCFFSLLLVVCLFHFVRLHFFILFSLFLSAFKHFMRLTQFNLSIYYLCFCFEFFLAFLRRPSLAGVNEDKRQITSRRQNKLGKNNSLNGHKIMRRMCHVRKEEGWHRVLFRSQ